MGAHQSRILAMAAGAGASWLLRRRPRVSSIATLDQLGRRYALPDAPGHKNYTGGDKTSDGLGFTAVYDQLLHRYRAHPGLQLLEIGVFNGASLAMWCDYFEHATIHGVDISLRLFNKHKPALEAAGAFSKQNVHVYECDSYSEEFQKLFEERHLDVIVDDGNHCARSQWHVFTTLWPSLSPGGLYFVEDIENPGEAFSIRMFCGVIGGTVNPAYYNTREVNAAKEQTVVTAAEQSARNGDKERHVIEHLKQSLKEAEEGTVKHTKMAEALAAKEAAVAESSNRIGGDGKKAIRAKFEQELAVVARIAKEVEYVRVSPQLIVLCKRSCAME